MAVGLNSAFDIARRALRVNLAAINVTGHNIANANTEGYSRQRVELETSLPFRTPQGIFGTGVDVSGVQRIRDELVGRQLRRQSEDMGTYEALDRILSQLETIFNEPSDNGGLRILLSKLFDDFQELANDPESLSIRTVVRESAKVLTEAFNRIDDQITVLSNDLERDVREKVDRLNELTDIVADLNAKIVGLRNIGKSPNDLLDARDRALDEMSGLIDTAYRETPASAINVSVGARSNVSNAKAVAKFKVFTENVRGNLNVVITGENDDVRLSPIRGEIYALMQAKNEIIPRYRQLLDDLASNIVSSVNNFHRNGVGLQGSKPSVPRDNEFFKGTNAGTFALADAIVSDVNNIAAAERIEVIDSLGNVTVAGEPGSNKTALEIARLKTTLIMQSNTATFNDYLAGVIGTLGVEALDASDRLDNQRKVVTQFQNIEDSTSGVSIDEEMTKMIQYQRAYQASARTITTVDELFQTLLGMA